MKLWTAAPILSVLVHASVVLGVARLPKTVAKKTSLVSVVEKKKKAKDEDRPAKADEPPPPPPKPIEPPKRAAKKVVSENTPPPPAPPAAPLPNAAAHPALAALPNLGLSMAGGPGGVGIAVPTGGVTEPVAATGPARVEAPKATRPKDDCAEDAVKPKLLGAIAQDRIIAAAQAAGGIEGKIRLELLVDETGSVTGARVLAGLGGAIDEAALSAARRAKVGASTKCGKPTAGRLVVAITVRNPD